MNDHPKFFDPFEEVRKSGGRLPHWQQPGGTYFITFNMADAIPRSKRMRLEEERANWLNANPEPWKPWQEKEYHERFSGALERWLDAGYGSCFLNDPAASDIVAKTIEHFDDDRYLQHAWVVMPNHVHLVVTLNPDYTMEKALHSWKSYSSHELKRQFSDAPTPFWQRDYFDRLIRDPKHFANCIRYIRKNPTKAKLLANTFRHYESQFAAKL